MATLFVYDGNATNAAFAAARQAFTQRHPKIRLLATNDPKRARQILDTQGALVNAVVTNLGSATNGVPGMVVQAYATKAGATAQRVVVTNWAAGEAEQAFAQSNGQAIRPRIVAKGNSTVLDAVEKILPQLGL